MSIITSGKSPKGYNVFQYRPRGGLSEDVYKKLAQAFPELLDQAKGSPEAFSKIEAPALRQFSREIAPNIAQRYAGMGASGSSGLNNSLASAGQDLAENLQAKRHEYMHNSMRNVLDLSNLLIQNPDEETAFMQKPEKKLPWWKGLLSTGINAAKTGFEIYSGLKKPLLPDVGSLLKMISGNTSPSNSQEYSQPYPSQNSPQNSSSYDPELLNAILEKLGINQGQASSSGKLPANDPSQYIKGYNSYL